ncbi:MAG TPA: hypothetical protein VFQ67_05030 [Allosphingosinicella sp.]|nr:hypothetical protein [Allosphingosinicella sp.]
MSRPQRPAWGWRLLAWTSFILVVLMPLPVVLAAGPKSWTMPALNWIAVVGAFSYAYGREPRFLLFWRIYALPFSFYTVGTLGIVFATTIDFLRNHPASTALAIWTITVPTLIVCTSVCIALLRHARLLRGAQRAVVRDLEGVFA